jgi:hypothetical protein
LIERGTSILDIEVVAFVICLDGNKTPMVIFGFFTLDTTFLILGFILCLTSFFVLTEATFLIFL